MAHPKEKRLKLEEIKEELITRLKCLRLQFVQKLVRAIYTTEPIGMRVSYITEVKSCLIIAQN